MPLTASRTIREVAIPIASGASQSAMINLENVIAASYLVPSSFTNTGATNLGRWGVSNNHDDPVATALIALLPDLTLAAAQTQRHTITGRYAILPDVLKFRSARFDGVATEAGNRTLLLTLHEGYVTWRRFDIVIPSGSGNSDALSMAGAIGGSYLLPSALTGTIFQYEVGDGSTNWNSMRTAADGVVAQTVAVDRWVPIPTDAFAFPYWRLSGNVEAAARVIRVDLKYVG